VSTDSLTQTPLGNVGLQPTKNLLFIVRICCPRFCFWTDILRLLVSFPSPLQEVGILCVCLCNTFVNVRAIDIYVLLVDVSIESYLFIVPLITFSFVSCSMIVRARTRASAYERALNKFNPL